MHTFIIFMITFFISCSALRNRIRARRNYQAEIRLHSPPCDVVCEAQWKSEFNSNFQKLYDTDYFDVPLDSAVIKNKSNLKTFCSSTIQKYDCLRRECRINKTPWSPEKHICIGEYKSFEKNIHCLSLTDKYVQDQCSEVCNSIKIELNQQEMDHLELTKAEQAAFIEQNKHCNFIACHQLCHEHVIKKKCVDNITATRYLVKEYYEAYLEREWNSFEKDNHQKLYSSFCKRVTPGKDENYPSVNMTVYNADIMDKMRAEIRAAFTGVE